MAKSLLNIALPEAIDAYLYRLARARFPDNRVGAHRLSKALHDGIYNILLRRSECFQIREGVSSLADAIGKLRFPNSPDRAQQTAQDVKSVLEEMASRRTDSMAEHAKIRKTPLWVAKRIEERAQAIIDSASENAVSLGWHQTVNEVFGYFQWHEFVPDPQIKNEIGQFVNAVAGAIEHPAAHQWINDENSRGQIRLLARISSWEKAMSRAAEWRVQTADYIKNQNISKPPLSVPGFYAGNDYEEIDVGLKGEQWFLKMKSPAFLDQEGRDMGNCIGDGTANHDDHDELHYGNYDDMLGDRDVGLYSYRDVEGPHVDFKVEDGVVTECEGRKKYRPRRKYESAIQTIIQANRWDILRSLASATRLIKQDGRYYNIFAFEPDFELEGSLYYQHIKRAFNLPQGLSVEGELAFESCEREIKLGKHTRAREIKIRDAKVCLAEGVDCDILTTDILLQPVANCRIGKVVYKDPENGKMIELSYGDFVEICAANLKRQAVTPSERQEVKLAL